MVSNEQDVAKFVFNTQKLDQIQLPMIDLNPGNNKEYAFAVSNDYSGTLSDVTVQYQITIETYHLIPLVIELYKVDGENEELMLTCDEAYTRNVENKLICNSSTQEMGYSTLELDNYKLKVAFPNQYNGEENSDLVDYINIKIKSWQKTED
jgi:hypothetical protein